MSLMRAPFYFNTPPQSTETFPLKPAERSKSSSGASHYHTDSVSTSSTFNSTSYIGNDPSSMLLSMWNRGKRSVGLGLSNREIAELRYQGLYQVVDLTKNFFFSYTYDLTRSLQENFLGMTSRPFPPAPFKDMYGEFDVCDCELVVLCSVCVYLT